MSRIVLASASPRRKELLEQIGLEFEICPAKGEEVITAGSVDGAVLELSRQKAEEVAAGILSYNEIHPELVTPQDILVIGADTVVACDGNILGKPQDEADAAHMLSMLSGHTHSVYTGVTLVFIDKNGRTGETSFYEKTDVCMYPLDDAEIRRYIAGGEPMDKAGSYGIQGQAAAFVKEIHGDYNNVVGLPVGRLYQELKKLGKPFLVLLNSQKPYSEETRALAARMTEKYEVQVLPVNCEQLRAEDIREILGQVLLEFPVTEIDFSIPKWLEILPNSHWLKSEVIQAVRGMMDRTVHMRDVALALPEETGEAIRRIRIVSMKMDDGSVQAVVELDDGHYYQILSEYVGMPIEGEYQLMQTLKRLASMQSEYEKASVALTQARKKGYGVVTPERGEIVLDEPQVVRHGNKYGVKMKAQAPSINLIKAQIETEIAPIVGNEQQAEDLIRYIRENAGKGEEGIWETNIFGKSIAQIVDDGIQAKISQLTEDCQVKLQDTLQKIINDSNGGMICIII